MSLKSASMLSLLFFSDSTTTPSSRLMFSFSRQEKLYIAWHNNSFSFPGGYGCYSDRKAVRKSVGFSFLQKVCQCSVYSQSHNEAVALIVNTDKFYAIVFII